MTTKKISDDYDRTPFENKMTEEHSGQKNTRKAIGFVLLLLGGLAFSGGVYYLGYHQGMEALRVGDSGLGGLSELAFAWLLITFGLGLVTFGMGLRIKNV